MDNIIVISYLLIILVVGLLAGRKVKNLSQFSVAGRSFGSFIIFATLSASFIGGGFSMGNAEKVFLFGIVNIFALWGFSLKEILVAKFIAPHMDNYKTAISVGDIMEKHYGKISKVITGIFSVIVCAGILGAQIGSIGYIFNVFLNIPQIYGILIGCGIVFLYSTVGGMRSVVYTDIIQFIVLAIGIPLTLVFGIMKIGGISEIQAAIPASHFAFPGGYKTITVFVSLFLTFLLGETLVPPYVQRLFLSKDKSHTRKGTLWSGIFSIPFFAITGLIGLIALALNPGLDPNLAMPYVIKEVLPIGVCGVVVAGIISIVMSSADSFLNAASVSFIHDIITPLRKSKMTVKAEMLSVRVINILVGSISVIFAIKIKSILDILIYAYNFWSPIILVPLVSAILGLKVKFSHFIAGAVAGVTGVIIWNIIMKNPFGIDGLIIGIASNAIVFYGFLIISSIKNKKIN
ncbi:MAG: sodium:solute symporter family protein [Candidatus Marinimicrobia bacterium]|nr:sodium:solute symporter family protein [Candidatus Neomarinimicrobiota bacterium]